MKLVLRLHIKSETFEMLNIVSNHVQDAHLISHFRFKSGGAALCMSYFCLNTRCFCIAGDAEASFTKEEMQQGKHQEYEKKLHEQLLNTYNHSSTSRDR
jgi:hypothetical protein